MSSTLLIRDESMSGKTLHEWSLDFLTERITVRELIRGRVYQEVQDYNRGDSQDFRGLVQPNDAEVNSTGCRLPKGRQIDWHEQFDRALEAFESNRVLILVDDKQADSLDQEIVIRPGTAVSFLKLTPLVGG